MVSAAREKRVYRSSFQVPPRERSPSIKLRSRSLIVFVNSDNSLAKFRNSRGLTMIWAMTALLLRRLNPLIRFRLFGILEQVAPCDHRFGDELFQDSARILDFLGECRKFLIPPRRRQSRKPRIQPLQSGLVES